MNGDLRELYQQMILDHYRKPRNFGPLPEADRSAEGYNPLCGDRIRVEVRLAEGERLAEVSFTGQGCAICTASASMMTESLRGRSAPEAEALFEGFQELVTGGTEPGQLAERLGKLAVFAGVRDYPVRIKCATLPWHTVRAALENRSEPVTTE